MIEPAKIKFRAECVHDVFPLMHAAGFVSEWTIRKLNRVPNGYFMPAVEVVCKLVEGCTPETGVALVREACHLMPSAGVIYETVAAL